MGMPQPFSESLSCAGPRESRQRALQLGMVGEAVTMLGTESRDLSPLSASSLAEAWGPHSHCEVLLRPREPTSPGAAFRCSYCSPEGLRVLPQNSLSLSLSWCQSALLGPLQLPSAPFLLGRVPRLSVLSWLINLCPAPWGQFPGCRGPRTHLGGCPGLVVLSLPTV